MFYTLKIAVATASIMAFGILPASAVVPQFGNASTTAPSLRDKLQVGQGSNRLWL
jgi:hypothetical protein